MNSDARDADTLVKLESAYMHLARDVEQMHQVLVAQQQEIDELRRRVIHFEEALERDEQHAPPEVRDPIVEKPPHY